MRKLLVAITLMLASVCASAQDAARFNFEEVLPNTSYRIVLDATTVDQSTRQGLSDILSIPYRANAFNMAVRMGTGSLQVSNATNSISGTITGCTFTLGLFNDYQTANFYVNYATPITPPPSYYKLYGDSSGIAFTDVTPDHNAYGEYAYEGIEASYLCIEFQYASSGAITFQNQGLTIEITFKRDL